MNTAAYQYVNTSCEGSGHIHFCSLADSRYEQIYEAVLEMPEVAIISSQFAFEYYAEHVGTLRGKLAVESFYGDALAYVRAKYGSFSDWADEFVARFKHESGLVMYCQVSSTEEGKDLWAAWQKAHEKSGHTPRAPKAAGPQK